MGSLNDTRNTRWIVHPSNCFNLNNVSNFVDTYISNDFLYSEPDWISNSKIVTSNEVASNDFREWIY